MFGTPAQRLAPVLGCGSECVYDLPIVKYNATLHIIILAQVVIGDVEGCINNEPARYVK